MPTDVSSRLPRWRWILLGLLVLGGLSVPTGIVYLQHRLQASPNDSVRPWDDPKIAQKLSDARLAKAKSIRKEWRGWALKHKDGLKAMLNSQGKDFSTLEAVYKLSPPLNLKDWRPDTRSGPTKFGWYVDLAKLADSGTKLSPKARAHLQEVTARRGMEKKLREQFSDKSDYIVAVSENAGPTETFVWASGRITERTWIQNPKQQIGQPSAVHLPHKELVPPYEFLISS